MSPQLLLHDHSPGGIRHIVCVFEEILPRAKFERGRLPPRPRVEFTDFEQPNIAGRETEHL